MIKTQMFIAAALLAGVAIGYFAGDRGGAVGAPAAAESADAPKKKAIADVGDSASVKALRRRVAELERALAETGERTEVAISNAVAEAKAPPPSPFVAWRERMEELKRNDPARYAQMTNNMARWRQQRARRARSTLAFLASIDTSRMGAKARETHDALQALLAHREELEAQLQQEGLTDAQRGALRKELWSSGGLLHQLNRDERRNLIGETVNSLGFEGDDAKEVVATIKEVIRATEGGGGPGPRHGGGPRGGGPGGGGPGGR